MTQKTIAIAALSLSIVAAAPSDLDQRLVATTGCSSREIETILSAGADRAAHALRPLIEGDAPSHLDLARAIAADPDARGKIRDLYVELAATPAPAPVAPEEDEG